ncbi:F-box protein At3g07870-like [Papaver somniferum]|uniref:F-box protein At3g07870-like n=1 Tax=Papaver somniferum TaxID=3469 RepID=UPI000E700F6B|nr:F-box protein At3g07870-like [Papaver somniferum]
MENLPGEITSDILSRVDAGSISPAKQVCKTWRGLLDHIKMGLILSSKGNPPRILYTDFDTLINSAGSTDVRIGSRNTIFEEFKPPVEGYSHFPFIGSCNGLLCVSLPMDHDSFRRDGAPSHIFNPITGEFAKLPGLDSPAMSILYHAGGFGYLHTTNEYKVVRICREKSETGQMALKVEVYTLGGDCGWRNKGHIPLCKLQSLGMLANGALYWLDYEGKRIVSFDLRDEKVRLVEPPPPLFSTGEEFRLLVEPPLPLSRMTSFRLRVLSGYLCLVHQKLGDCLDVWLLKKKNATGNAWGMEFGIKLEGSLYTDHDLITITKTDEVLFCCKSRILCCYDLKTKALREFWERDSNSCSFQAIPHMKSSISLKGLGEKSVAWGSLAL